MSDNNEPSNLQIVSQLVPFKKIIIFLALIGVVLLFCGAYGFGGFLIVLLFTTFWIKD
jgi:hypothetical protein